MVYTISFWTMVIIVFYSALTLISKGFDRRSNKIILRRFAINDFKAYVYDKESRNDIKDFFKNTGLKISTKDYIAGRLIIISMLVLFGVFSVFSFGVDPFLVVLILLAVIYFTLPRYTLFGIKTPLSIFMDLARKNYLHNVELELFSILTVLKNLIITSKHEPMSAETIIMNVIDFANLTKKHFYGFLTLYRVGKVEQAYEYFKIEIGTKLGEDFASILIKLDVANPSEFIQQLELYQGTIRDRCVTNKMKKDKLISDFAFIPVVGILLLILLNLVAIAMFIDTIAIYQELFG